LVTDAYRETARTYTTDSLMANMNQFEKQVEARLQTEFTKNFFILENLTSGLTPPKSLTDEIERTNAALQRKRTIANEIENSKMENQKALIDAKTNEAKSQGLTKEVLTDRYIQMLQGVEKVYITDGKTPIIMQ
jgi:antitoxin component YwqK of YwqJK toxin-antitoxin module